MGTLVYDRNTLQWDRDVLDDLIERGQAKLHVTTKGPVYVVKNGDGSSYAVRSHQIVASAERVAQDAQDAIEQADYEETLYAIRREENALLARFGV